MKSCVGTEVESGLRKSVCVFEAEQVQAGCRYSFYMQKSLCA